MTYGDFITKLRDWEVQVSPGVIGEAIVLSRKGGHPFVTVIKRQNEEELLPEVVEALLTNLQIPHREF